MSYYNKLFKDIFSINIPLKDSITPLTNVRYFCNKEMGKTRKPASTILLEIMIT